ncbi:CPBP family intramembrane glutamic endopeptidase [Brevundimonas staleyi]|uniref:CPBP family intramembrane glutamic endopeptidase n=2 Tax=Brevundimonas staleyi TaxID=74326 RepID=A0ABW0FNN8_9CAUL
MLAPLTISRPWLKFGAFILLTIAAFFGAGLVYGIVTLIFPDLRTMMTGESSPLPETSDRLLHEGAEAFGMSGILGLMALAILLPAMTVYGQRFCAFLWPSRRFDLSHFWVGGLTMTCLAVIALPWHMWQGAEWAPPIANALYDDWTKPAYVVLMAVGLLIAAAAEEIVFRGVLLRLTALVVRHPLLICLINGLAFSALHLDPNPVAFVARMMSGAIWTWAALRLGGLEFATGAHLAHNLMISLLWAPLSEIDVGADTPWTALAPEVVTAVVIVLMTERLANRSDAPDLNDLAPRGAA